ncbi:Uncharacterized protein BP5553_08265 [Venustampulla echinocandica]|uniref:FAD protein n=1 Tax=Venustampulla echinocandica TaxID=2656787 RepID=A0A370TG68_9HELO|nr:Uncharacterized protein BP5553_08265 [Venustampulla echinocandica]RDL33897.1 Uncharacterized protein BP5553_08265 [Venustampulla echinocandica]
MSSPATYSALIIGSGQAATPLALAFASAGHKTALIERSHIGGCCVNEGCTPTKTLIASGRAAYITQRGQDYGIHTQSSKDGKVEVKGKKNEIYVDMLKVRQRKRDIVDQFRSGSERRLKAAGVDVLMGEGSFVDSNTVKIKMSDDGSEMTVKAEKIFINVGDRPALPALKGVQSIDPKIVLDSTSIQELDVVPEHLIVVGGGYVGVEFAQLMRRLGAKVTILQRGKQLLPREDPDIAVALKDILEEDGLVVHLQTEALDIRPSDSGPGFMLRIGRGDMGLADAIPGSHLLYAVGRTPNTESLNLSKAGIATNPRGYIVASEFLETSNPNVFVMGDVKGPPAFTHVSYDDFRILKHNLLPSSASGPVAKQSTRNRLLPYVVYTDPQLGHIGLHLHEALAAFPGHKIKAAKMPMSYVARALETDETRGVMKAVVNMDTGKILGFTCLGMEGGEVMSVVQMAMIGNVGWEALRDAVWAHPTLSESLNNLWGFLE